LIIGASQIPDEEPIIAVDRVPKRLALARELGATHSVNTRRADLAKRIPAITGGGVDHVVENTGDAAIARLARRLLNPGGRLAILTGGADVSHLPGGRKVLSVIQGDAVPQRFIPHLIRLHRDGRFPFDRLVKFYDFRDINQAIADSKSGKTIKPVLCIGEPD